MKLSEGLDPEIMEKLRASLENKDFPGITFAQAMHFLLTDGVVPASGLPVESFFRLEDWVRRNQRTHVRGPRK
ncbi:MAG TPA: hypothetical protein VGJ84_16265 [Polyangiaceae bacterium]|jgi:hypothetical protein